MNDITPENVTVAETNALVDALLLGDIWRRTTDSWGPRFHGIRVLNKLVAAGLLQYSSRFNESNGVYAGGWVLTDKGRELARELPDTESSASRQHKIDTGKYLPYGEREELNPPKFEVGQTVQSKRNPKEHPFLIVGRTYVGEMRTWLYSVEVAAGKFKGTLFDQAVVNPEIYEVVKEHVERDWELLAPVAAQAAVLVALGRGDEVVEDYADNVITALELLTELVEAGK